MAVFVKCREVCNRRNLDLITQSLTSCATLEIALVSSVPLFSRCITSLRGFLRGLLGGLNKITYGQLANAWHGKCSINIS